MGVKNGKCESCGADVVTVDRIVEVYKASHKNPTSGRDCTQELTLSHEDARNEDNRTVKICPGCAGRDATFAHVTSKFVPKAMCPKGCF